MSIKKSNKTFYKRMCLCMLLTAMTLLGACGTGSNEVSEKNKESEVTQKTDSGNNSDNNNKPEDSPTPLNETANIKNVSVTVNSIDEVTEISDSSGFISYEPKSESSKFVRVNLSLINNDNKAVSLSYSDFNLVLDEAEYSSSIVMVGDDYIDYLTLNPGISKTGYLVFELPSDKVSANGQLKYKPEFFSSKSFLFNLQ